jgi:hypothetical protein
VSEKFSAQTFSAIVTSNYIKFISSHLQGTVYMWRPQTGFHSCDKIIMLAIFHSLVCDIHISTVTPYLIFTWLYKQFCLSDITPKTTTASPACLRVNPSHNCMKRREQKERENIISTVAFGYIRMRGNPTYINYHIITPSYFCRITGLQLQNSRRICRQTKVMEKPQHKYGFI